MKSIWKGACSEISRMFEKINKFEKVEAREFEKRDIWEDMGKKNLKRYGEREFEKKEIWEDIEREFERREI